MQVAWTVQRARLGMRSGQRARQAVGSSRVPMAFSALALAKQETLFRRRTELVVVHEALPEETAYTTAHDGTIVLWDYSDRPQEASRTRVVFMGAGKAAGLQELRLLPSSPGLLFTASLNGTVCMHDVAAQASRILLGSFSWDRWFTTCDIAEDRSLVVAGDNHGYAYFLDPRTGSNLVTGADAALVAKAEATPDNHVSHWMTRSVAWEGDPYATWAEPSLAWLPPQAPPGYDVLDGSRFGRAPGSPLVRPPSVATGRGLRFHKNKLVHAEFHPADTNVLLTAGHDKVMRLWDVRKLSSTGFAVGHTASSLLSEYALPANVNAAYFSPGDGARILATTQNDLILVYDVADGSMGVINHPNSFYQHMTPIKASWHPIHPEFFVVGSYKSLSKRSTTAAFAGMDKDAYAHIAEYRGIDLYNAVTLDHVAAIPATVVTEKPRVFAVNKFSATGDVLLSGSGHSLYAWRPVNAVDAAHRSGNKRMRSPSRGSRSDDDDDDDGQGSGPHRPLSAMSLADPAAINRRIRDLFGRSQRFANPGDAKDMLAKSGKAKAKAKTATKATAAKSRSKTKASTRATTASVASTATAASTSSRPRKKPKTLRSSKAAAAIDFTLATPPASQTSSQAASQATPTAASPSRSVPPAASVAVCVGGGDDDDDDDDFDTTSLTLYPPSASSSLSQESLDALRHRGRRDSRRKRNKQL
ncbi:DNA damage-binding protein 2 [Thecamonas trahens ATCC 50062]|uniref:DNA damage-binding protein 2 n=1 Tax=Thecamonas trahens ATCC 50062 TaxID=461836 RepID=A0A0L0D6Y2_THETB|nr:DNA damage-binding protein 2 [Thecamonas trahens ATCC 50062]KNC47970.1 DNA damage-binding protein 2 [Thecamonas trahens ATCC 50062]|eukprot:XP_013758987.1 DNA damage-binding protein 2 [Thecamonas trahens ATCC 50062]